MHRCSRVHSTLCNEQAEHNVFTLADVGTFHTAVLHPGARRFAWRLARPVPQPQPLAWQVRYIQWKTLLDAALSSVMYQAASLAPSYPASNKRGSVPGPPSAWPPFLVWLPCTMSGCPFSFKKICSSCCPAVWQVLLSLPLPRQVRTVVQHCITVHVR